MCEGEGSKSPIRRTSASSRAVNMPRRMTARRRRRRGAPRGRRKNDGKAATATTRPERKPERDRIVPVCDKRPSASLRRATRTPTPTYRGEKRTRKKQIGKGDRPRAKGTAGRASERSASPDKEVDNNAAFGAPSVPQQLRMQQTAIILFYLCIAGEDRAEYARRVFDERTVGKAGRKENASHGGDVDANDARKESVMRARCCWLVHPPSTR